MYHGSEVPARPQVHMLDGVNPIPVDVRKGNPEFIHFRKRLEGIRRLIVIDFARTEVDIFKIEEIPFKKFR